MVIEQYTSGQLIGRKMVPRGLRDYLIEKNDQACLRCGWRERNPVTGRVPLEIEHLDGDWRNTVQGNLAVLCPNCHSLTPTFRGLNRGRGRPGRPGLVRSGSDESRINERKQPTVRFELTTSELQARCSAN